MARGPLSKRKKLEICLMCNKGTDDAFNGIFYRNLLLKYLTPPSKDTYQFNGRIFNFCKTCGDVVQKLSRLKKELDAILTKINETVESMKFTMIIQKSSGDIDVDYFRSMALCDLRPSVRLTRSQLERKNEKSDELPAQKMCLPKIVESTLRKVNLNPRVRMDINNALMSKPTKNDPKLDSRVATNEDQDSEDSNVDNVPVVTVNELLESILQGSQLGENRQISPNEHNLYGQTVVEMPKDDISTVATDTSDQIKLSSDHKITSETASINNIENQEPLIEEKESVGSENKDYPFLEEIEQFDPWNDPSSLANETADPLDVQMENVRIDNHSLQFNEINYEAPRIGGALIEGATEESERKFCERPTLTYNYLIVLAIKNSESNELSTEDIYEFIMDNFPYYRAAKPHWKSLIRKCLNNTIYFWKIPHYNDGEIGGDRGKYSVDGKWSVKDSQCSLVRNAIALLCQKNRHLMAFPERLDDFTSALFKISRGRTFIPDPTPLEPLPGNIDNSPTLRVENNLNPPMCSNSYLDSKNITLHGMLNELLNKGPIEESDIKINANLELEFSVPNVVETKPMIKLEDANGGFSNYSASTSLPQIVNSYSCQIAETEDNGRIEVGVSKNIPVLAVAPVLVPQIINIPNENGSTSKYICPTFSPSQLAILALANSPNSNNTLGTRQIIEFIQENFPYYRTEDSWKKGVFETLNTNRCYFKRNLEQGRVGPLISWSIEEVEPHYSQIKLQILRSLKESLSINYRAAISYEKLEEIVKKALGSKYDLSFLKKPEVISQPQQPQLKATKYKQTVPYLRRGLDDVLEKVEETQRQERETIIVQHNPKKLIERGKGNGPILEC